MNDRKRICIVEDNVLLTQSLSQYMNCFDFEVKLFESVENFFDHFGNEFDCELIISDINLPGMDGYSFCRKVREIEKQGRTPFILMTGDDFANEKTIGLEAGADDFLHKPFVFKDLKAKIESLLKIRKNEIGNLVQIEKLRQFLSPNIAKILTDSDAEKMMKLHEADVSVFFVDLRGFTAFSEQVCPTDVQSVLSDLYTIVGRSALKHKGTLGHLAGDGVMVFFNDPEPIDRHQEVALRMAIEVREKLGQQRNVWHARDFALGFGIGICSGTVTIGGIGFDLFSQYSAIGPTVNLAARFCDKAMDDQILVSNHFLQKIEGLSTQTQKVGEVNLKGMSHPITIQNVISIEKRHKTLKAAS